MIVKNDDSEDGIVAWSSDESSFINIKSTE